MPELRKTVLFFVLVTLLAASFRLTNLPLMEYKGDEAINVFLASRVAFGHPLPPGGTVSSIGILNPPLFTYLLTPILFFTTNPISIALFISLINTLSVGFFFLFVKRFYGFFPAFFASILLATSPWAIIFSRKIWTQNLVFPLSLLFLYTLHKAIIEKSQNYWIICGISMILLFQLHQANIILLVLFILFAFFSKMAISWRKFMLGIVIGSIPLLPYLFYQFTSGCSACFPTVNPTPLNFQLLKHLWLPLQLTGINGFYTLFGSDLLGFTKTYPFFTLFQYVSYALYFFVLFCAGVFYKAKKKLRILVFLLAMIPFINITLRTDTFIHYYLSLLAAIYFFIGVGVWRLFQSKRVFIKTLTVLVFTGVFLLSVTFTSSFFSYLSSKETLPGDYGNIFRISNKIAEQRFESYKNDPAYEEMLLASYVPLQLVWGQKTIAPTLYNAEETKRSLKGYEKRLQEVPQDHRLHLELIAYYTREPVTYKTILYLYERAQTNPGYETVFASVLDNYLHANGLKRNEVLLPRER